MNITDLIKKHEGLVLVPKPDAKGMYEVGYGHDIDPKYPMPSSITVEQAEALLNSDIIEATGECQRIFIDFTNLDEVRQAVLIDMAYELGEHGLSGFKILIGAVENHNWQLAAQAMYHSLWAREVPERFKEDQQMMLTGEWPL
jgi:lysozyme